MIGPRLVAAEKRDDDLAQAVTVVTASRDTDAGVQAATLINLGLKELAK